MVCYWRSKEALFVNSIVFQFLAVFGLKVVQMDAISAAKGRRGHDVSIRCSLRHFVVDISCNYAFHLVSVKMVC